MDRQGVYWGFEGHFLFEDPLYINPAAGFRHRLPEKPFAPYFASQQGAHPSPKCEMITGIFTRSSLRGWGLQHCHSLQQLVQQPQPLISLRSFSLNTRPTSVLVRAQAISAAEQSRPATHSFNNLGLGEELLAFLAEHNLHTPTEIQVRHHIRHRKLPIVIHDVRAYLARGNEGVSLSCRALL